MVNIATLNGQVHLYVVHRVDKPRVVNMLEYNPIKDKAEVHVQLERDNEATVEVDVGMSEGPGEDEIQFEEDPQPQIEVDVGGNEGPVEVDVGMHNGS